MIENYFNFIKKSWRENNLNLHSLLNFINVSVWVNKMVSKLMKWGKYLLVNVSKNGRNSERHRIYVLIWFDLICVEKEEEEESWETIDKMAIFKMAHIIDRILLNFISNLSIFKLKKSFIDWIIYRSWGRNELILCQNEGHNRKKV